MSEETRISQLVKTRIVETLTSSRASPVFCINLF